MKVLQRRRVAVAAPGEDDVASWPDGNTSTAAKGYWKFTNSDNPMIRVCCYGMGAGDAAHNDADSRSVE